MYESVLSWLGVEDAGSVVQPRFEFQFWFNTSSALILLLAFACITVLFYSTRLRNLPPLQKIYLIFSRTFIISLALFLAMNPVITGYLSEPGDQYILLLFDDSHSMDVAGNHAVSRGEQLLKAYEDHKETFEDRLTDRYRIMKYKFGNSLERIRDEKQLRFQQNESNITAALQQALMDMSGTSITAIVLFSDGQEQGSLDEFQIQSLDDYPVNVYVVGTGEEVDWSDAAVRRISYSRSHFDQNPVIATVDIEMSGLEGETVVVEMLDKNKVIDSKEVKVTSKLQTNAVQFEYIPERKEWIAYTARIRMKDRSFGSSNVAVKDIQVAGKDFVTQNNQKQILVDATQKNYRVLYFSGRPNWENKFIRQALVDDPEFRITSLIRISAAETKFVYKGADTSLTNPLFDGFSQDQEKYNRYDEAVFLRLGAAEHELVKGFPTTPEELFAYDCVIFGDIEPDYFSVTQLELTKDFVDKRGGALLLLGGDRSFVSQGDSTGVLSAMIPVVPDQNKNGFQRRDETPYYVQTTLDGELSGTMTLSSNPDENIMLWQQMPPLYGIESLRIKSIGADTLAKAQPDKPGEHTAPFLLMQRYGKGKCVVLSAADTWQWQMQQELEDPYHERLWRQIMRYMVNEVPGQITIRKEEDQFVQGNRIPMDILIQDKTYEAMEGAQLEVTLTKPSSIAETVAVDESIEEPGIYQSEWEADEAGMYSVQVSAKEQEQEQEETASVEDAVLIESDMREFQHAQFNPSFLQEIATRTNGHYFTLQTMDQVVDQLPWKPSEDAKQKTVYLWYHPYFAYILCVLLCIEWFMRRRKGLA
jgi:uncharacterized membrane protein